MFKTLLVELGPAMRGLRLAAAVGTAATLAFGVAGYSGGRHHSVLEGQRVAVAGDTSQTPPAWFREDFAQYTSTADLLKSASSPYSINEDVGTGHISLDQTDGVGQLTQSMRYRFPSRAGSPKVCRDFTIARNVILPEPVEELWVEIWAKFGAGFATRVPQCAGQSSAGYKFVFFRVRPSNSRFNLILGVHGGGSTWGYPGREQAHQGGPRAAEYFDGRWHRWRFHVRVGAANGLAVAYLDDRLVSSLRDVPINRKAIYSIALGRNINQGPLQEQTLSWGLVEAWRSDPGWGF